VTTRRPQSTGVGTRPANTRSRSALVANEKAVPMANGAMDGLSQLQDAPDFRHSLPTGVVECMVRDAVVTRPLSDQDGQPRCVFPERRRDGGARRR
jgi:hypothetical protein